MNTQIISKYDVLDAECLSTVEGGAISYYGTCWIG